MFYINSAHLALFISSEPRIICRSAKKWESLQVLDGFLFPEDGLRYKFVQIESIFVKLDHLTKLETNTQTTVAREYL